MTESRTVTISVGFERKVSLMYQTWVYPVHFTETVTVVSSDELARKRKILRLRAMAAVYADILNDFDRIAGQITPSNSAAQEQAKGLQVEAQTALQDAAAQLAALENPDATN